MAMGFATSRRPFEVGLQAPLSPRAPRPRGRLRAALEAVGRTIRAALGPGGREEPLGSTGPSATRRGGARDKYPTDPEVETVFFVLFYVLTWIHPLAQIVAVA